MNLPPKPEISGIITARDCPYCGHHEIGVTTGDGIFYPLRPGTRVQILEEIPPQAPSSSITKRPGRYLQLRKRNLRARSHGPRLTQKDSGHCH